MADIAIGFLFVFCLRLLWDICKLENRVKALEKEGHGLD